MCQWICCHLLLPIQEPGLLRSNRHMLRVELILVHKVFLCHFNFRAFGKIQLLTNSDFPLHHRGNHLNMGLFTQVPEHPHMLHIRISIAKVTFLLPIFLLEEIIARFKGLAEHAFDAEFALL